MGYAPLKALECPVKVEPQAGVRQGHTHPPGNSYGYQSKGVTKGVVCICMKAKRIAKGKMGNAEERRDRGTDNRRQSHALLGGDENCAQVFESKGVKCVSVVHGRAQTHERTGVKRMHWLLWRIVKDGVAGHG